MSNMFSNCKAITELDLRNFNISNVKYMSTMFSTCYKLTKISFGEFSTPYLTEVLSMFNACSNLINLDLSSFDTSNVTNMSYMFSGCSKLTSLNLSNFDTSKVTDMSCMFQQCSKLNTLNLSGFYTAKVTNMWCMFHKCLSLKYLDISNFDTSNVTNLGSMFGNCENLTNLDLSKFNTSKATNMRAMFLNCSNLINLNVSAFNTSKVTDLAYMFGSCSSLKSIDLSSFTIGASADVTNMLNFGTGNNIKKILTPKKIWKDLPITSNSVLFDTSTGSIKTSIAKTTDENKTFVVKINLTVDADGGECDASTVGVYYDAPIGESGMASLPTPTKAGAEFLGWRKNYFDTVEFMNHFNNYGDPTYRVKDEYKSTLIDYKKLKMYGYYLGYKDAYEATSSQSLYSNKTEGHADAGIVVGDSVYIYWKPTSQLIAGKYRLSYNVENLELINPDKGGHASIMPIKKGSGRLKVVNKYGEAYISAAACTLVSGTNTPASATSSCSAIYEVDSNFLGFILQGGYSAYFENIKFELIETADGSVYPAEAKVSSESSFNVEQSISAIWEAVPVEVTIKVRVENNVSTVGLGSGTVSYIDATGRATSLSISGATTTVKVLQGSDLSVKVTAKTDYVFIGATKEGTTPHPTEKPSDTTEFLGISEDTTINIYINLLSQNILKYDEIEKYFYFECGMAPQSYVGNELNERLRASNDRSILGDSFGKINGFEAIDDSGELFAYSIYDSVEGSWGDYVGIKANKTQGLLLNDEWVEVVAGGEYWFKVETIRWRVSDYGVSSTDYPEGWSDYGSINYRFNAVSDKIIWANSLTTGQYDAGTGWSAKDSFRDCADNIFGNLQIVDMYGTSNVVKANIQGNTFADAGSDNVSGGASVNLAFANESTLREKFNDLRAKVTDFSAFVMGIDSNQFARYWIGDLGSKYYNVKSAGVNGNIKDAWTTNILGCRLVAYFYGGSRL